MRVRFFQPAPITVTLLFVMVVASTALAQTAATDLKKMTIEELMDVDVTSVSRASERLADTAAAVTVITAEDIRRSGATDIPEVLRLVPGLQVARFAAGSWAISARGFNSTAANKLLVMIDGRTVYSPLFSGTFWEVQDLVLEDIARIEVVRGPGATLWGANAVNGVINIITKSTHQTKSNYADVAGGGAEDLGVAALRVGGAAGADTSYRVFGKYSYRDQLARSGGADANDSVRIGRTGFRVDTTKGDNDITLEGEVYRGLAGFPGRQDGKVLGGDLVSRWNGKLSNRSELQLQAYFSRELRRVPMQSDFRQRTLDIDLQHRLLIASHAVTWGAEYRWNADVNLQTPVLSFVPAERTYPLVTAFVQDEVSLAADKLKVQFGSKFEHNDFNGFEIQPSIRALWSLRSNESVWGAVSRAVRTPTRFDSDIRFGPPGFQFVGNPDFDAEKLVAFELGYRRQTAARLSLDVASFYNVYDSLRSLEFQPAAGVVALLNNANARTYGVEVSAAYDVSEEVRLTGGYSFLGKRTSLDSGHVDVLNGALEGNDPRHQFMVHGSADVDGGVELDSTFRFVSRLPAPAVPRYAELDARVGWNATSTVELSLVGRNLLHRQHPEFGPVENREEVQRNVYGRLAFRF
jgi:iron complex outermembrane receptor protein